MFDIGMMELLIIGIVALIVVGPKDLPGMFRTLGRFTGKARAMAREFQRAMESAADESGVKDMAREFKDAASGKDLGADELRAFSKGPKHWAREAARKSTVPAPEDEAAADEADAESAAPEPRPRGPATQALAEERAEAARSRRAEVAARSAGRTETHADAGASAAEANASAPADGPQPAPASAPTPAPEPAPRDADAGPDDSRRT